MFKVNNKDTRTTPLTTYCQLWTGEYRLGMEAVVYMSHYSDFNDFIHLVIKKNKKKIVFQFDKT